MCAREQEGGRCFSAAASQAAVRAGRGATRIGEMQGADAGRETACLLACLLACCVCTCGTIRECVGVVYPARRDERGREGGGLYMAWDDGVGWTVYVCVCVSLGNQRTLAIFFPWPQCVSVCEPGGDGGDIPMRYPEICSDDEVTSKQASRQANLATFHGNSREYRVCTAPRHDPRKRRRVSRLEAGRRYRRAHCLTLGICYDDAVLGLRSPRSGLEKEGRDRGGDSGRRREKRGLFVDGDWRVGWLLPAWSACCCRGSGEGNCGFGGWRNGDKFVSLVEEWVGCFVSFQCPPRILGVG